MCTDPRSMIWRRRDTERRLAQDVDVRGASASVDGAPYLVRLSFDRDDRSRSPANGEQPVGR